MPRGKKEMAIPKLRESKSRWGEVTAANVLPKLLLKIPWTSLPGLTRAAHAFTLEA